MLTELIYLKFLVQLRATCVVSIAARVHLSDHRVQCLLVAVLQRAQFLGVSLPHPVERLLRAHTVLHRSVGGH